MNNKPVIPIFVRAGLIAKEKGALALYLKNTPIVMMSAYKLGLEGREVRERFRNLVKDFYNATGLKGFLVSGEIDRSGKEVPGLNIKQVVKRFNSTVDESFKIPFPTAFISFYLLLFFYKSYFRKAKLSLK